MYVGVTVGEAVCLVAVAVLVAVGEGVQVAAALEEGVAAMTQEGAGSVVPVETWALRR